MRTRIYFAGVFLLLAVILVLGQTNTPNLGMTEPTQGVSTNWGTTLNANMNILDSAAGKSYASLTDGATVTWALTSKAYVNNATVTLGGNRTLAITGAVSGSTGVLIVKQDSGGSRTLGLPAGSKVVNGGGGAVTLTATGSAVDILSFSYDGTNFYWNVANDFN